MKFRVIWEPESSNDLHLTWVLARDPSSVRAARDAAEELLAADPYKAGEHVSEGLWRMSLPPLRLQYSINSTERTVTVNTVTLLAGHEHP